MINIVFCQDAYGPICIKLSMVLDRTKLYSMILAGMTLMLTQRSQGDGKARPYAVILLKSCMKQIVFMMDNYVREMTVNKSFMVNMDCLLLFLPSHLIKDPCGSSESNPGLLLRR